MSQEQGRRITETVHAMPPKHDDMLPYVCDNCNNRYYAKDENEPCPVCKLKDELQKTQHRLTQLEKQINPDWKID